MTKKERKKTLYKNSANLPKVSLIVAFFLNTHCHHLNPCLNCALSKSLSNSPSRANIMRGCAAAANALCYRRCAAAANALHCRAALSLPCKVTTVLCRCAAAAMLPLPMH